MPGGRRSIDWALPLAITAPYTALVLAGRREARDEIAAFADVPHRALLPVLGVPMLARVVRALRAARSTGPLHVSIDAPPLLREVPELLELVDSGALVVHESEASPSRSVLAVQASLPADAPLLVTTADHALLTPELVDHFTGAAEGAAEDVLVGAVAASVLRARYPDAARTILRLRGEGYSGANLFLLRTARARAAVEFWVRAERFRKRPWRLVSAFGAGTLLAFLLGRLDLAAAEERISRAVGARVRVVPLPCPDAAVDVDRPADLALAERILAAR